MGTHSDTRAWEIPWSLEGYSPRGRKESDTEVTESTQAYHHLYRKAIHAIQIELLYQFSSVAESSPTLCDHMNRSTPGLPVHHQLLEFTQTHIHRVSDAIQPSHPRSSPFPPAPKPFQHQSLSQ